MTKGEDFFKNANCKHRHRSAMSNSACCDLKSGGNILKLHDNCPNPKFNCQKAITFTQHQNIIEGGSIKSQLQKIIRGTQTAGNKFLQPAINATAPFMGMPVSAKTQIPKVGEATTNFLKSISGGKILSLTDMHRNGSRFRVM